LAGLVSALGFIVGYDPHVVYRFMEKVNDFGNIPLGKGTTQS
jgi:hypothetical protein